jgi:transposase InsO family protein
MGGATAPLSSIYTRPRANFAPKATARSKTPWLITVSPRSSITDQGSQFTGSAFTGVLTKQIIAISMDGKGAWRDNVFVERLWRTIKYEEVYLRAYESISEARASIGRYLDF